MEELHFSDNEQIYGVGDRAEAIFAVVSGFVILRRPGPGGASREQLIGPGAVFGAAEVLAGTVRSANARAHGNAVVAAHLPETIVNAMIDRPEAADAMAASLIADLAREELADKEELQMVGAHALRLIAAEQAVIDQMGEAPITIDVFPFVIGRESDDRRTDMDGPVSLVLADKRPFSLSRRHFSIDKEEDRFIVRDYRSFHGTIVNGETLNAETGGLTAPLDPGENEIIAGDADSPFRFSCIVPALPGS